MEYKGKMWHDQCFQCVVCTKAIGSSSFVPKDDTQYCVGCYEEKFASRCKKCNMVSRRNRLNFAVILHDKRQSE